MLKRSFSVAALFLMMALVGGMFSLMLAEPAAAVPNPDACPSYECTETGRVLYGLSCISCCGCSGDTPYAMVACTGVCDFGGACNCEYIGCHAGFNCD